MKRFVSILSLTAVMALALLTSCEKQMTDEAAQFVGDWKLYSVSFMGLPAMTIDEIKTSEYSAIAPYLEQAKATLRSDYTFTAVIPQDGSTKEGTWSYKDGKISLKSSLYSGEATYADGALALPYTVEYSVSEGIPAIQIPVTAYYKKVVQ